MAASRTTRIARWSVTHPWRALLVWALFVGIALAIGSTVSTERTTDADYRVGESGRAEAVISSAGLDDPPRESVVITSRAGALDRADAREAADEVSTRMARADGVARVDDAALSADGQHMLVSVELARPAAGANLDAGPLQAVTESVGSDHPDLRIAQVGDASLDQAIGDRVGADLAKAERLSLPLTLIILLVAFGALLAAAIPVLLAISGVLATIAIYAPLSHLLPADDSVSSMVLLIGMAVGVDYSLFYLKREREERERGRGPVDALEIAAATSGHSIVVSGMAVVVAMAGLYVVDDATFSSLATGAILVVAISVIGSLTVLPALLSKLGRWVDRPRVPLLWRVNRRIGRGGITRRLLAPVLRHPWASLLLSAVAVVALAAPLQGMNLRQSGLSSLPQDLPEVRTLTDLQAAFPSRGQSLSVVVETTPAGLPGSVDALRALDADADRSSGFAHGEPADVRTSKDSTVAMLTLSTTGAEGSSADRAALATLRDTLVPRHLDRLSDARWAVGGDVAQSVDDAAKQTAKLPWVIGFVLLLTSVMMGLTFRSVIIALLTTVLNLASVAVAFGVLTLVFQNTWAEGLLGFTSTGYVVDWIPLFMFVVLVGLSMDYHVFVLSRIKENIDRGLPQRLAVEAGISETAGIVTSAAAVMVSVFAVFATLSMLELKQMGVGLAVSVLVDATLVRVVMLPSMLVVLGRFAWWPARPATVPLTEVVEPQDVALARQP